MKLQNILLFVLALLFIGPFLLSLGVRPGQESVPVSQVLNDIKENKVENVKVSSEKLDVTYKDGGVKYSTKEPSESFAQLLKNANIEPSAVQYSVEDRVLSRTIIDLLGIILPVGLMAIFFLFIFRQARGAQDNLFSFGKSGARLFAKGKQNTTFKDVAGVDEAKKELEEVVDFLKNPGKYKAIGARTPKGVLLVGPAGVGKTLLARAVAGEAGVPFFSMAGSEFMEMLVGVGASRVRDLFSTAKKASPAIIFIDEIDAIGRQRGFGLAGGHDEREQTLNQILVEMDGFTPNDNVVVLAATNRGDLLDPALLRPGRFDRRVALDLPDKEGRVAILKIHAKGKKFALGIDWDRVASRTVGFSGADLENMLNEAAILAARDNKDEINMEDVEEAATKVKLGPAKRRLQSKEDKEITAYHEAGHALVAHILPHMDPVHRISIVARGMSLGHTYIPPEFDRTHETKTRLLEMITMMLGGRAAENLMFNEMTAGAANDIENATHLARRMVVDFGMSELGPVNWGAINDDEAWRGRLGESTPVSQGMQEKIDNEISKIMEGCYSSAMEVLKKTRAKLNNVAKALIKEETLDRDEFEKIVGLKKVLAKVRAE
ncbi:MAG: cell division protein FtsH [Candidatus Blackburnbacteria bacterium RIFCSPHIGHO2_02_FULL_39_13]|uniref:ATP-dependent zinc metalloprotease FtsH n=1 Tax=Candidatus Blackburnbacteria bacterium RIFCSPLOWO2_01_FULL_40_20 TaxID=1797519 RepID=A0A1G1VBE8_9BACT|nr:MAG: cell division protein FtsH [Candidatus Blackburnbacteria bacterium RIFCSPHIGHO2_01_FULL_40_17]OGY08421.1 MAG: cell division protein FtsH [Candidatus Blackburnbacteria bacterium RIFCSPHIGHO2_02_FULL_39_13]OGY12562.1 MAG: cell division protein FtsH [Candidatus Blackburnbacteria bacterium RIFCSPLOWO2_01_FULL_40_20]